MRGDKKDEYRTVHDRVTDTSAEKTEELEARIHRLEQVETALRDSETRLLDIIDFLPDPTFAVNPRGEVIIWNRAMEDFSGVPAHLIVGKGDHEYALPFWGRRRPVLVDLAIAWSDEAALRYPYISRNGFTLTTEVYIPSLGPEGTYVWAKASPLFDSKGNVVGAIESIRDITPQKKLEIELRESAEKYQTVLHSLPVGVLTLDADLRVTGLNAEGERITGVTVEELLGQTCDQALGAGICESGCPIRYAPEGHERLRPIETTVHSKGRGRIPVRLSTARLVNASGELIGVVEVFQDISRLRTLERERANMVSMFAHDMKSPLVGIQGFAVRLVTRYDELSPEQRRQYLEIIRRESAKLEALINDFLDFSRLQIGSLRLNFGVADLHKEFVELVETYHPRFLDSGIDLELRNPKPLPTIKADVNRLRRVFNNLLDNALKYSPPGTRVVLEALETEKEVVVRVADQGVGIAPEDLNYVFDMFYRGDAPETPEGYGLGLAGVEAVVRGHGGRVFVSSETGVGSVFTVMLPKG